MTELIYNEEQFIFSGELNGFSGITDEQPELTGNDIEDFWQQLINLFI